MKKPAPKSAPAPRPAPKPTHAFSSDQDAIEQMRRMTQYAGHTAWAELMNEVANWMEAKGK